MYICSVFIGTIVTVIITRLLTKEGTNTCTQKAGKSVSTNKHTMLYRNYIPICKCVLYPKEYHLGKQNRLQHHTIAFMCIYTHNATLSVLHLTWTWHDCMANSPLTFLSG